MVSVPALSQHAAATSASPIRGRYQLHSLRLRESPAHHYLAKKKNPTQSFCLVKASPPGGVQIVFVCGELADEAMTESILACFLNSAIPLS
jgi:hypothetical protein